MKKINLNKIFYLSLLALTLSLPVLLPSQALAKTTAERCADFQKQFQVSGTTIIGDRPVFCSASELILKVINYALILSGIITILFLIVGGFWYLTSAGNDEQAEKGRKTLTNSVIGLVIIILSYTIVRIVAGTITVVKN